MISRERRLQLQAELPGIYTDLLARALRIAVRHRRSGRGSMAVNEAEDLLQGAIVGVLSGERDWPMSVDLFTCLAVLMRSLAANASSSSAATESRLDDATLAVHAKGEVDVAQVEERHAYWTAEREEELRAEAMDEAQDDPAATAIVKAILGGATKAAEIIEDTELPAAVVYVGIRKLKRRLAPLADGWRRP